MSVTKSQNLIDIAESVYTQAVRLKAIAGTCAEVNQLAEISAALHKTAAESRKDDCDGLKITLAEAVKRANI